MEILNVQHLSKTYGSGETKVEALRDVSFSLEKGEFAAVIGESGSGKSTLLNCIGGLDMPSSGKVLIDGQDLFAMGEEARTIFRRRSIGFVFQSYQLVPELDVEQNIIFSAVAPIIASRSKRRLMRSSRCSGLRRGAIICRASFPAASSSASPSAAH